MKLEISQGVRQDHLGRTYSIAHDENGNQHHVRREAGDLSEQSKAMLTEVEVESQGKLGTTYRSLTLYQSGR